MIDNNKNVRAHHEQLQRQAQAVDNRIKGAHNFLKNIAEDSLTFSITEWMDTIEQFMNACGAESKLNFLEVTRDMIKIYTRVPLEANVYPFLEETPENIRLHKVITQSLLILPGIQGIRWIPVERGCQVIISVNPN